MKPFPSMEHFTEAMESWGLESLAGRDRTSVHVVAAREEGRTVEGCYSEKYPEGLK